jgi:ABC-type transport system involved in cytochrome c biogenesis permease subunit
VFYFYGSLHHRQLAWGLFVLPLVLGLVVLAEVLPRPSMQPGSGSVWELFSLDGRHFWPLLHGSLVLLAAVGVSVGFVASVMYLVQSHRLKAKLLPGKGVRLLSLERLEAMNRRAINLAFPLLTAGLFAGVILLLRNEYENGPSAWEHVKFLSALGLWVVFLILLYLRYGFNARGRLLALLTILAFVLLLSSLVSVHPFGAGGGP